MQALRPGIVHLGMVAAGFHGDLEQRFEEQLGTRRFEGRKPVPERAEQHHPVHNYGGTPLAPSIAQGMPAAGTLGQAPDFGVIDDDAAHRCGRVGFWFAFHSGFSLLKWLHGCGSVTHHKPKTPMPWTPAAQATKAGWSVGCRWVQSAQRTVGIKEGASSSDRFR